MKYITHKNWFCYFPSLRPISFRPLIWKLVFPSKYNLRFPVRSRFSVMHTVWKVHAIYDKMFPTNIGGRHFMFHIFRYVWSHYGITLPADAQARIGAKPSTGILLTGQRYAYFKVSLDNNNLISLYGPRGVIQNCWWELGNSRDTLRCYKSNTRQKC